MTAGFAFVLLLLQTAFGPGSLEAPGSIEGTVLRSGTQQPVQGVSVVLISNAPTDPENFTRETPSFAYQTNSQGRFVFEDVAPGSFVLTFSANGYVRQEYGQHSFPGRGSLIRVAAGEAVTDLDVELTPTGSVNGTVRDENGRALVGVPVQLMRPRFDVTGHRMLRPFGTVVETDDRGQYRIYLVTPGRYYVNAGTPQGPPGTGDPRLGPNQTREFFTSRFYPGATDISFASAIEIRPGADIRGIDFTLSRQQGVRVTGRIVDARAAQWPENPDIDLAYRDPGTGWDYGLDYRGRSEAIYENGNFEFLNVLPGRFTVTATVDAPSAVAPSGGVDLKRAGYVPIDVDASDVEGIVVVVSPGTSIFGRVRVEGMESAADAFFADTPLGVNLEPMENGARPSIPGLPTPSYGELNPDGTFRIDNVMPGQYRLTVAWLRENFYIKSARLGATDILIEPFEFTGRQTGDLDIIMSPEVASIDGVVTDDRLIAVEGAQVVLVPDRARHRPELFKAVRTTRNGRFTIPNISPGDYKLYAWEGIEPYGWFDLGLARQYEAYAVNVHVAESAHLTVSATLIPVASR